MMGDTFADIVDLVIIGSGKKMMVEGEHITTRVSEWLSLMMNAVRSPLTVFTFNKALSWNLEP